MTATINRASQTSRPPLSFNRESLTAEIVLATDQPGADGYQLQIRSDLAGIQLPQGRLPILRDHQRSTAAQIGWIESIRFDRLPQGLNALVGIARFHPERSADLLDLIEAGALSWSASFQVQDSRADSRSGVEVVDRFRLLEVSAVAVPLDPNTVTRSITSEPMSTDNTSNSTTTTEPVERSAKEIRRENAILNIARAAGITDQAVIDRWIESDLPTDRVSYEAVRAMRIRLENGDVRSESGPAPIGHPAQYASPTHQRDLGGVLAAKMGLSGDGIKREWASMPMHSLLREVVANDPDSRGLDLAAMPITKLVNRAWSTSDFTKALESSTERMLLGAYEEAQVGVIALATSRDLADFRPHEMIRVSQYGEIAKKNEGGEYVTSDFAEELAATLTAAEYGSIATLTRKALIQDNLGIFGRLVAEMGRAAARKERSELAARLLGISFGSANSTTASGLTAAGVIAGITAGTLKLRRQTDIEGNPVAFEPTTLLVPPELEAPARQALADYNPTEAGEVNPYRTLTLEIDHYLTAPGVMYLHDSRYPSLVIGRIGNGPLLSEEEEFKTGNRLYRCLHDFGTAVMDTRSICKVTLS
ncbi:phage protease [Cyanobium sp. Copco_Reservoir_LC18]|uniref:phage major capsid protein n=1 Tax=Cyanobium sp. Copco_Reservoir_LC18 TaxID=1328305 RepID=UPI0013577C51|nr:hypothetical protein [Cyanobium sp. Copco_Reservoir_LC18]KAF0652398.1 phage protease [Cyanobium sp. Copco_Reservoir_LC18]